MKEKIINKIIQLLNKSDIYTVKAVFKVLERMNDERKNNQSNKSDRK